ncbi:histidinol-phosphate transaminase [bacterium]|nr:histidinol-phosphate transaminase [bacterium]
MKDKISERIETEQPRIPPAKEKKRKRKIIDIETMQRKVIDEAKSPSTKKLIFPRLGYSRRMALRDIRPYEPGRPISEVQREFGLERVVKLASNENPLGPSPLAMEAVQRELTQLHRYPDAGGFELRRKLGDHLDVNMSNVILGNGSTEIVEILCEAFLDPGDESITSEQAFFKYVIAIRWMGGVPVLAPMKNFTFDLDAIYERITNRTKLIFIANPNNPTGTCVSDKDIARFIEKLPDHVITILDEAYYEFLEANERPDTLRYVREERNVVVLRTFSKAYGIAGLRIGYGIAPEHLLEEMNIVREAFNTSHLAQAAAYDALDDVEFLKRTREHNRESKRMVLEKLDKLGIEYTPTSTNFVLIHLDHPAIDIFKSLLVRGVIVRPMRGYGLPNSLRITFGKFEENELLFKHLEAVLDISAKT